MFSKKDAEGAFARELWDIEEWVIGSPTPRKPTLEDLETRLARRTIVAHPRSPGVRRRRHRRNAEARRHE